MLDAGSAAVGREEVRENIVALRADGLRLDLQRNPVRGEATRERMRGDQLREARLVCDGPAGFGEGDLDAVRGGREDCRGCGVRDARSNCARADGGGCRGIVIERPGCGCCRWRGRAGARCGGGAFWAGARPAFALCASRCRRALGRAARSVAEQPISGAPAGRRTRPDRGRRLCTLGARRGPNAAEQLVYGSRCRSRAATRRCRGGSGRLAGTLAEQRLGAALRDDDPAARRQATRGSRVAGERRGREHAGQGEQAQRSHAARRGAPG